MNNYEKRNDLGTTKDKSKNKIKLKDILRVTDLADISSIFILNNNGLHKLLHNGIIDKDVEPYLDFNIISLHPVNEDGFGISIAMED